MLMTPTEHEKAEWSRLAQSAYECGLNAIGHRYSTSASLPRGATLPIGNFDELQTGYRNWLIEGFRVPRAAIKVQIAAIEARMAEVEDAGGLIDELRELRAALQA
jgi:hypothetical protein